MSILVQAAPSLAGLQVDVRSNKTSYLCGEPVLLQTTVSNFSKKSFVAKLGGFDRGGKQGVTMEVASGDLDFSLIGSMVVIKALDLWDAPLAYKFFHDRHWLPGKLLPGARVTRLDVLVVPKPGEYRLKTVLRDAGGQAYASVPVRFVVSELKEGRDSITRLGGGKFAVSLGSSVLYAHYIQELWGGYGPGPSLVAAEFERAAQELIQKHKDSVFREYALYAATMVRGSSIIENPHGFVKGGKELAQRLVREYPTSWLLPDVYRILFFTAVEERDYKKAVALREKVLEIAPWATVLRDVRQYDLKAQLAKDRAKKASATKKSSGRPRPTAEPTGQTEKGPSNTASPGSLGQERSGMLQPDAAG